MNEFNIKSNEKYLNLFLILKSFCFDHFFLSTHFVIEAKIQVLFITFYVKLIPLQDIIYQFLKLLRTFSLRKGCQWKMYGTTPCKLLLGQDSFNCQSFLEGFFFNRFISKDTLRFSKFHVVKREIKCFSV